MKVSVIGCSTTWSDRPTSSYCINDNILVDAGEGTFKYYEKAGVDFEKNQAYFCDSSSFRSYLCGDKLLIQCNLVLQSQ